MTEAKNADITGPALPNPYAELDAIFHDGIPGQKVEPMPETPAQDLSELDALFQPEPEPESEPVADAKPSPEPHQPSHTPVVASAAWFSQIGEIDPDEDDLLADAGLLLSMDPDIAVSPATGQVPAVSTAPRGSRVGALLLTIGLASGGFGGYLTWAHVTHQETPFSVTRSEERIFMSALAPSGWSQEAAWKISVPDTSSVTTLPSGSVVVSSDSGLMVYSGTTGKQVFSSSGKPSDITPFSAQDSKDAVAWITAAASGARTLHTWSESHGERTTTDPAVTALTLYGGSEPVLSGTGREAYLVGDQSVKGVSVPDGAVAVGGVSGNVIAAGSRPPIWLVPDDGSAPKSVNLTAPAPGLIIRKWVAVSGDSIVVVWDAKGDPDPARSVWFTVHNVRTGEVLQSLQVPWSTVSDPGVKIVRSQDLTSFALGTILYSDGSLKNVANATSPSSIASIVNGVSFAVTDSDVWTYGTSGWSKAKPGTAPLIGETRQGYGIVRPSADAVYALKAKGK